MLKLKCSLVVSAATVAVAAAPVAAAYSGPCETDNFGRCVYAPIEMATPDGSPEDWAAYGDTPDQWFAYFVTHDDDVPNYRITNFDLLKAQALEGCELRRAGMGAIDVIDKLQRETGYSEALTIAIIASGGVAYCNEMTQS